MVDIVVPVYNALEFTKECVRSIVKNTDLVNNRLVIVNDKSTDKNIDIFFSKLVFGDSKNIVVINNDKNLGFVKSVNIGMRYGRENDVILLNSDTVVTKGWLEKMERCAYSNDLIATVPPFSNNALICSIPVFMEDNVVPHGFSIDSFASLVEKKSLKLYPELPSAHGFCMYIKRSILDIFGYFNEDLFETGYGEENEFSLRVRKGGYRNVLDDTTYIFHKGTVSFTKDKRDKVVDNHLKIVEKLYPGFLSNYRDFVNCNPLQAIHDNLNFWINRKNFFRRKVKTLLVFVKNIFVD